MCFGGGDYEEEGNGLEYRQSNINKHRKKEKHSYSGLRLAYAVTRSTGESGHERSGHHGCTGWPSRVGRRRWRISASASLKL